MNEAAILGTFVSIKTMADGSPRITLDMQCTLSEVAAMGLIPGVPFALARLAKEAAVTPPEAPKEKPGPLCVMACNFCEDPLFWKWFGVSDEEAAKQAILSVCGVWSRKDIDTDRSAADIFHTAIRKPFLEWKGRQ